MVKTQRLAPVTGNAASARCWTGFDPEPAVTIGPGQAANSAIGSAPEFCTKNVPIFQDFGFGTNLLIYAQTHCGVNA